VRAKRKAKKDQQENQEGKTYACGEYWPNLGTDTSYFYDQIL
jgi:hypothetical protein